MQKRWILFASMVLLTLQIHCQIRDPHYWPFSQTSIWNTPIGDGARYIHAGIRPATAWGMTIDEDCIHMYPDAPLTPILYSSAGWDRNKDRCEINGGLRQKVPLKKHWEVSKRNWDGLTPNSGLAVLMPDGRTIKQNQPFARCEQGKHGTTGYTFRDEDIFGDGIQGAHGGSRLSAIGGAIRVGELVPGGEINHVLKVNLFAGKNLFFGERKGHRWPAPVADGYANATTYAGLVEACTMGSLLALPYSIDLDTFALETEPARILARTFQRFGAYIVDDTAWDVYALVAEWGPEGRVATEFESVWGYKMQQQSQQHPWARDIRKIMAALHVVDNNLPDSIGGGGTPLAPLAPEFGRAGNIAPKISLHQPRSEVYLKKGDTISLVADAFDVDGSIEEVQFFIGGNMVGRVTSAPYEYNWVADTTGTLMLVARAIDNEYGVAVTHGLKIHAGAVQTKPTPRISLVRPNGSEAVNDGHSIELTVELEEESTPVSRVEYFEGFHFLGSSNQAPFKVTVGFIDAGTHYYIARAYGQNGTVGFSNAITVISYRENDPPTCTIIHPANHAVFENPQSIPVDIDAIDVDSEIQKVELYMNDKLIRSFTIPPFQHIIQKPQTGDHTLYAKIFDTEGAFSISDTVNMMVSTSTGIDQNGKSDTGFTIYPNPLRQGDLIIHFDRDIQYAVKIISAEGRVLFQNQNVRGKYVVPLDEIKYRGLCIVQLSSAEGSGIEKIILL